MWDIYIAGSSTTFMFHDTCNTNIYSSAIFYHLSGYGLGEVLITAVI